MFAIFNYNNISWLESEGGAPPQLIGRDPEGIDSNYEYGCLFFNNGTNILCGDYDTNGNFYMGWIDWVDDGKDLSTTYIGIYNENTKVFDFVDITPTYPLGGELVGGLSGLWNGGGGSTNPVGSTLEVGTEIVWSHTNKFASILFDIYQLSSEPVSFKLYISQQADDSWVQMNAEEGQIDYVDMTEGFTINNRHLTWKLSWDTVAKWQRVTSTGMYSIKMEITSVGATPPIINASYGTWLIPWHSQEKPYGDDYSAYDTMTPLTLKYDSVNGLLHGCFWNRWIGATLKPSWSIPDSTQQTYRYFVIDMAKVSHVPWQSPISILYDDVNFEFDESMQLKGFAIEPVSGKCYCTACDVADSASPAGLIEATYDKAASTISLTKIDTIWPSNYDCLHRIAVDGEGSIFGLSLGENNVLWQYGNDIYLRVDIASIFDMNSKEAIIEALSVINGTFFAKPSKYLKFVILNDEIGTIQTVDDICSVDMASLWEHTYDGVSVDWEGLRTDDNGTVKLGIFGKQFPAYEISNVLIQSPQLAKLVSEIYFAYYFKRRMSCKLTLKGAFELEFDDILTYTIDTKLANVVNGLDWRIAGWRVSYDNETVEADVVEVKS
jgi:hypothetical protein